MVTDPARFLAHVGAVIALVVALAVIHPGIGVGAVSAPDRQSVLLVAASSLSVVSNELEAAFEASNTDVDLEISLGGSAALREQVLDGVPADVLITANREIMAEVELAGRIVGEPVIIATNGVVVAVPTALEGVVERVQRRDLSLVVGLCEPEVPCGRGAQQFLVQAKWPIEPATLEPDVRSVVAKLEAQDLDAGVVYRTDVEASDGRLIAVPLGSDTAGEIVYPVAIVRDGPNPRGAAALVAFLTSPESQEIFARHGFTQP